MNVVIDGFNSLCKLVTVQSSLEPTGVEPQTPHCAQFSIGNTTIPAPAVYTLISAAGLAVLIGIPCAGYLIYKKCCSEKPAEYKIDLNETNDRGDTIAGEDGSEKSEVLSETYNPYAEQVPVIKETTSLLSGEGTNTGPTTTPVKPSTQTPNLPGMGRGRGTPIGTPSKESLDRK
jgi:hypothetical protein